MKEKTYVDDIDRNIYDFKNDDKDTYKLKSSQRRRMTLLGCRISGLSHYRYIII